MDHIIKLYKRDFNNNKLTEAERITVTADDTGYGMHCYTIKNISKDLFLPKLTLTVNGTPPTGASIKLLITDDISIPASSDLTAVTTNPQTFYAPHTLKPSHEFYIWIEVSNYHPTTTNSYDLNINIEYHATPFDASNMSWFSMADSYALTTITDFISNKIATIAYASGTMFDSVNLLMQGQTITVDSANMLHNNPIITINYDHFSKLLSVYDIMEVSYSNGDSVKIYVDNGVLKYYISPTNYGESSSDILADLDHVVISAILHTDGDFNLPRFFINGSEVAMTATSDAQLNTTVDSFIVGAQASSSNNNIGVVYDIIVSDYLSTPTSTINMISQGLLYGRA